MAKKPVLTYTVIAINSLLFIAMMVYDRQLSYPTLVNFGAKVNFRIADYKFWHLVMPMFLHGSVQHLLFNNLALYYFAPLIEFQLGRLRFAVSYIAIGIIAAIGSFIFVPNVSLGASGVIYGFMAYHLYLYLLNKQLYLRIFGNSILQLIAVNLALTFLVPNIDIAGHLFGFIGGFIVYSLIIKQLPNRLFKPLAIVLLIAIGGGFFYRMLYYPKTEDYFMAKGAYYYQMEDWQELQKVENDYQKFLETTQ
ncbi:MAG: hypothetical protein CR995_00295 [Clostridiales bacterium]|nr:MAG: hypothetical protein CR995_00295 [Clostridiales bacterium]